MADRFLAAEDGQVGQQRVNGLRGKPGFRVRHIGTDLHLRHFILGNGPKLYGGVVGVSARTRDAAQNLVHVAVGNAVTDSLGLLLLVELLQNSLHRIIRPLAWHGVFLSLLL